MPKNSREFPITLNFGASLETKQKLTAMGYLLGNGGEIASPARNCIEKGLRAWLASLSEAERREYDEILGRVKVIVTVAETKQVPK